ncbi:MBL fold metallo-hydrolase [Listeria fleischmannii]|jgi:hydroxyacylglutathione hydrolase|uniref:MBL fold metallo-hydrolase n=1 Tax=Listeria fleischmannii TaxID=1069827 RepID=UPI001624DDAD|nr:MBL fold metallo-hydrolase [Listeria fleischmannii]MBC1417583.1 MBL fold metallo-hydrolase [Listeria fleischmannii]
MLKVEHIVTGPVEENTYVVHDGKTLLVVDPGSEPERIEKMIEETGAKPVAILLTHTHYDHIGALDAIRDRYQIPVYVSPLEQEWLSNPEHNGSVMLRDYGFALIKARPAEFELEMREYDFSGIKFKVVPTPGHSIGSVSFIFDDFAIVGDALFKGSIGRTDLYTGSTETLLESIRTELFSLPDETIIYPGHRESSTIGFEKATNPYFN